VHTESEKKKKNSGLFRVNVLFSEKASSFRPGPGVVVAATTVTHKYIHKWIASLSTWREFR